MQPMRDNIYVCVSGSNLMSSLIFNLVKTEHDAYNGLVSVCDTTMRSHLNAVVRYRCVVCRSNPPDWKMAKVDYVIIE